MVRSFPLGIPTLYFAIGLFTVGCSSSTPPQPVTPPPQHLTGTSYNFYLDVLHLRALDPASGTYILWFRMTGDTALVKRPLTFWMVLRDSLAFPGTISLPHAADSIEEVSLSIEPDTSVPVPTSVIITGNFVVNNDSALLSTTNPGGIGNYASAEAVVTFATRSSDTNRAKSEFYLMQFQNGVPVASGVDFPIPPPGWSYGLWVLDSNFYPQHRFFYGSFLNPDSASSMGGEFPFPGGSNLAPLNDPGARLEVTLEPDFSTAADHPPAPSPFVVLWTRLRRFIDANDTIALQNAWSATSPAGTLKLSQ